MNPNGMKQNLSRYIKHMLVKNEIDCYGYIIIHLHAKNSNMDHYGNFNIVTTY